MSESWKDVAGYEGLYQVSDQGNVRSMRRPGSRGGILKPGRDGHGYLRVVLYREGKWKPILIHRLVAQAFIPNPSNLPVINHKDENPRNNVADNLEWCTQKYNSNYGTGKARMAAKHLKVILQFNKSGNLIKEWLSASEVERQTGFAQSNISDCCLGKRKSAYGYIWRFK